MRRTWFGVTLALAVGVGLASAAWAQGQPQVGGTLVYAAGADPDSLDPANTDSNPGEATPRARTSWRS